MLHRKRKCSTGSGNGPSNACRPWYVALERKFFKNSACKPWFWALRGKKVLEFKLFFHPPRKFCNFSSLIALLCDNFLPKSGNFPNFVFSPSKTRAFWQKVWRFLLEKGENWNFSKNFACKPWFWALCGKKVARIQAFFDPPLKFCKNLEFYSIFKWQFLSLFGWNCKFFFSSKNLGHFAS